MGPVVWPYVRAFQLGAVSSGAEALRFLGDDTTSCHPYPSAQTLSLLGSVSPCSYRQALGGPFIVELFAAGLVSTRPRVLSSTRSPSSPKKSSRRRTALAEPDGSFTRIARRLWSDSRVRISRKARRHLFKCCGSKGRDLRFESVSVAPHPRETMG